MDGMQHRNWTYYLSTFGCKVNQYESQALREAWDARGGMETGNPELAEWIILNTCAVTSNAVSEARQAVRRLHRSAPSARIVITGCSATAATKELAALPGVTAVVPQLEKQRLLHGPGHITPATAQDEELSDFSISGFSRARPVIKVQDGCTHRCTYCIIPLMRGPSKSREPEAVIAEARRLFEAGHREIMISGINLHQYRLPDASGDFWDLVAALDSALRAWKGLARIRLSSLDPAQLGAKALDVLASSSLICPHLHVSLQSGSPSVLRSMGRGHYRPEDVLDFIEGLSQVWPLFGLGADLLMGFPSEADAHFQETLNVVAALPFSYAHVFPFSPRPGTPAARLQDLPGPEKQARAKAVRAVVLDKERAFMERLLQESVLHVAPDMASHEHESPEGGTHVLKGVCEYYTSCVIFGVQPVDEHALFRVTPARIAGPHSLETQLLHL